MQNWMIGCLVRYSLSVQPRPNITVLSGLTYDSIGLCSKGTHTGRAWGDLELGEAPLRTEVFGKETGWGQAAERHTCTCTEVIFTYYICLSDYSAEMSRNRPRLFVPFGILCSKDVYGAMVAGDADERCILVKINAAGGNNMLWHWQMQSLSLGGISTVFPGLESAEFQQCSWPGLEWWVILLSQF